MSAGPFALSSGDRRTGFFISDIFTCWWYEIVPMMHQLRCDFAPQTTDLTSRVWSIATRPYDEAVTKLIYLALRDIVKKWQKAPINWTSASAQFAIQFGTRFDVV
jgi:hypothetical protein